VTRGGAAALASMVALALGEAPALAADPPSAASSAPSVAPTRVATSVDGSEPARHPPTSVRLPLILGGLGFTAATYGIGAGAAAAWPEAPGASKLYIPVAGPWLALAENRCPSDGSSCDAMVYVRGILEVLSGLAQIGGLAIAVEGFVATTEAPATSTASSVRVTPSLSPTTAGLTIGGVF